MTSPTNMPETQGGGNRLLTAVLPAVLTGMLAGLLCFMALSNTHTGGGDFGWSLRAARDLLQGRDPYAYPVGPDLVSYPLPAALAALPLTRLPDEAAAALFFGVSSGLLAWCFLQKGSRWQMLVFLSWPFLYGLLFAQWPPLLACLWFLPSLMPLVLVKPNIALPLALTGRLSRPGIILTALVLIASLVIYPTWPWVWIQQVYTYQGLRPPLLVFPLGPLLLLALFRWRDRRAWLLVLMALMPQRVVYDQLALLLVAKSRRELLTLTLFSWLSLPVLWRSGGWIHVPGGWQLWILLTLYLPALAVLLRPDIASLLKKNQKPAGAIEPPDQK